MRSSAKHGGATEKNRGIGDHVLKLHQRLNHALNLGSWENREKWHCSDNEIQSLVLRSIDAFLDCISGETLEYPIVKDAVVNMVRASVSILGCKSPSLLRLACQVTLKMFNTLPSSALQAHIPDFIIPLANLLPSTQIQISRSCASALIIIMSKLRVRQEREVGQILEEMKIVSNLVHNLKQYYIGDKPVEYFCEMALLLSNILWRWPSFRFPVWNDSHLLKLLDNAELVSDSSLAHSSLRLYSTLALCGCGAQKLLEDGESITQVMLGFMKRENPSSVRLEAFKLARCLVQSKTACMKMLNICCEPLVQAVVSTIFQWHSSPEKLSKIEISVVEEACRVASITRWLGDHHRCFWKEGVDKILLQLILNDYPEIHKPQHGLSVRDLIIVVKKGLGRNYLPSLRPYVWDILGGLGANLPEDLKPEILGDEFHMNILIICACVSFVESVGSLLQISRNSLTNMSEAESAARAVLMLVYSSSTHISTMARSVLHETIKSNDKNIVKYLLQTLNATMSNHGIGIPGNLQIVVSLISLACYYSLPNDLNCTLKLQGENTIVKFIQWWLKNPIRIERASLVPHLRDSYSEKSCCSADPQDWEGKDTLLLFSLCTLSESLSHSPHVKADDTQLFHLFHEICLGPYSPGSRWYASYILGYFGLFGFPSKLGNKIGKLLGDNENSDLTLVLIDGKQIHLHEVIITIRCPSLIPSKQSVREGASNHINKVKEIHMSNRVDHQSLLKLLEYVYSGYLQANERDLVKKVKIIARHCKLDSLLQMLSRRYPKWGAPMPSFDLSPALGPHGHHSSDIILEPNNAQEDLQHCKCVSCSLLTPHLHAHKVILMANCEYFRALFQSGMQDSTLQTMKVDVSWDSLNKLVNWFYSDHLPIPKFDCAWNNMDPRDKLVQVLPFIELRWLGEFWVVEDLSERCYEVAVSCLDSSDHYLSAKVIRIAANYSMWDLVQVAADQMAKYYHVLRNSGEFDDLDDNLVEMIRAASVRLSQEGNSCDSS